MNDQPKLCINCVRHYQVLGTGAKDWCRYNEVHGFDISIIDGSPIQRRPNQSCYDARYNGPCGKAGTLFIEKQKIKSWSIFGD